MIKRFNGDLGDYLKFDRSQKACQAEHESIVKSLSEIQQRISSLLVQNVNSQESNGENATTNIIAAGNPTSGSGVLLPTLNGYVGIFPTHQLCLQFNLIPFLLYLIIFFCFFSTDGCLAIQ